MGVFWEILLAVGLGAFILIGIVCGIKANRGNREIRNVANTYAGGNTILAKVLEIKGSGKIYNGRHRADIIFMFDMKGLSPIMDDGRILAYWIPNVSYTYTYNGLTILGEGDKNIYWFFEFDQCGRLVQNGLLTDEQLSSLGQ